MPWRLESAAARHTESPGSFDIPTERARRELRVGDGAKLLFFLDDEVGNAGVERMWVSVTEVGSDGYIGRLDNEPLTSGVIERGELVEFAPDDIADIMRKRSLLGRLFRR